MLNTPKRACLKVKSAIAIVGQVLIVTYYIIVYLYLCLQALIRAAENSISLLYNLFRPLFLLCDAFEFLNNLKL